MGGAVSSSSKKNTCPALVTSRHLLNALVPYDDDIKPGGTFQMYETHFNGGRCFRVFIDPQQNLATIGYAMYKEYPIILSACKDDRKKDTDDTYLLDRHLRYERVWIAHLPKTEVNLSKGIKHFQTNSKRYAGYAILFLIHSPSKEKTLKFRSPKRSRKVSKRSTKSKPSHRFSNAPKAKKSSNAYEYLFVGDDVFTFRTRSPIVQFESDVQFPNDIVYSYAIDANGDYYFMNERKMAPAAFMNSGDEPYEVDRVLTRWYVDADGGRQPLAVAGHNSMFTSFPIQMLIPNPLS